MTDRHSAYIVVLSEDIREDSSAMIINALRMISGVSTVEPVTAQYSDVIARARRDTQWQEALRRLIHGGLGEGEGHNE